MTGYVQRLRGGGAFAARTVFSRPLFRGRRRHEAFSVSTYRKKLAQLEPFFGRERQGNETT